MFRWNCLATVSLFGKWDNDGPGMAIEFYSTTGSYEVLNTAAANDVFTLDIDAGSGSFGINDKLSYAINYTDICISGKVALSFKYIGGNFGSLAKVSKYSLGNWISDIVSDGLSTNLIADFEIDGNYVYAGVNLNGQANFGSGTFGSANDAVVLKALISITSPNPANVFQANGNGIKIRDIQFESQIYNELTVVGDYTGTMLGWAPTMTPAISSGIMTGFIARFDQNLQTLSTYQLEDVSLLYASATAIYDDPDGMVVVGVLEGGGAEINTILNNGSGNSAGTNDVSGPGLKSMWVAQFNGGGAPNIEWMSGSSSNIDMVVTDVIYDFSDQQFFVGGSYSDNINLPPTSSLNHPFPNQELGFVIRGGEYYGSGQGTYYKTDNSTNNSSVNDKSVKSDLVIYPNPNNGQFTIQLENENSGIVNITIIDVTGRMVFQTSTEKDTDLFKRTINLSSVPTGMYLITIENNGAKKHQKIMVK